MSASLPNFQKHIPSGEGHRDVNPLFFWCCLSPFYRVVTSWIVNVYTLAHLKRVFCATVWQNPEYANGQNQSFFFRTGLIKLKMCQFWPADVTVWTFLSTRMNRCVLCALGQAGISLVQPLTDFLLWLCRSIQALFLLNDHWIVDEGLKTWPTGVLAPLPTGGRQPDDSTPLFAAPPVVPPLLLHSLRPSLNSLRQACRRRNDVFGGGMLTETTADMARAKDAERILWILVFLPNIFSGSKHSLLLLQSSHWQWVRGQRAAPSGHNSNTLRDVHLLGSRFRCSIKYSPLNQWKWINPRLVNIHFCAVFPFEEAWRETTCRQIILIHFTVDVCGFLKSWKFKFTPGSACNRVKCW